MIDYISKLDVVENAVNTINQYIPCLSKVLFILLAEKEILMIMHVLNPSIPC